MPGTLADTGLSNEHLRLSSILKLVGTIYFKRRVRIFNIIPKVFSFNYRIASFVCTDLIFALLNNRKNNNYKILCSFNQRAINF